MSDEVARCPVCFAQSAGERACPRCGTVLVLVPQANAKGPRNAAGVPAWLWAAVLLGAVAVLAAVIQQNQAATRADEALASAAPSLKDRQDACDRWEATFRVAPAEAKDPNDVYLLGTSRYYERSAADSRAIAAEYHYLPDLAAAATAVATAREQMAAGAAGQILEEPNRAYRWVCGENPVAVIGVPEPGTKLERTAPAWLPAPAPGTDYSGR